MHTQNMHNGRRVIAVHCHCETAPRALVIVFAHAWVEDPTAACACT